jgi:hypothetical protein
MCLVMSALLVLPECVEPPVVDHALVPGEGRAVGHTLTYTCGPGYWAVGAGTATCTGNGRWTDAAFACIGNFS